MHALRSQVRVAGGAAKVHAGNTAKTVRSASTHLHPSITARLQRCTCSLQVSTSRLRVSMRRAAASTLRGSTSSSSLSSAAASGLGWRIRHDEQTDHAHETHSRALPPRCKARYRNAI